MGQSQVQSQVTVVSPPLIAEAHLRLLGRTAGLPAPACWEALCPLAALCWGRRAAWISHAEPSGASPAFPDAHQPALGSEFEQYAILCTGDLEGHGAVCVSFLIEIMATADAPPQFLRCLTRDYPRIFSIACDVFSIARGEPIFRQARVHALSNKQNATRVDSPHILAVNLAGGFAINDGESPVLSISADGTLLQASARNRDGDYLKLLLRSSASEHATVMYDRENFSSNPGVVTASTVAGRLAGGSGTSYTWPNLSSEGSCWVQVAGLKMSLGAAGLVGSAWHTRSRSIAGAAPPLTAASIWIARLSHSFARLLSCGASTQLHGTARGPMFQDDRFVKARVGRRADGRLDLRLDAVNAAFGVPTRAGVLSGIFQQYVIEFMQADPSDGGGTCLTLAALDFRETLTQRLRSAGARNPILLARSRAPDSFSAIPCLAGLAASTAVLGVLLIVLCFLMASPLRERRL